MKGYWHFAAISVTISIFTIYFDNYWFIAGFLLWLFYLFYMERLGKVPLLISLAFFLFFTIYIPSPEINETSVNSFAPRNNYLSGQIIGPVNHNQQKVEFIFQVHNSDNKILIIYFPDQEDQSPLKNFPQIRYGATCELSGKLELPDQSRNPGQFDYRNYLLTKDITHQIVLPALDDIECRGSAFLHQFYNLRSKLIKHVERSISKGTAAWLNALVLGDDSLLPEETVELFQRWSLSHILAISGLHVGLVVGLVYFLLIKLNLFTKEKAQWIMILFLPIYALIAGGEPSVWRASTMVLLFIILNKMKLHFSVTDVFSIVFILLILFDKYIVYHVGFQLSFIVTFGLILSKKWISTTNSSIMQIFQISFVSQMMILPLQLAYFSNFQPLSILLNVIIVPYFSLIVIPSMFLLLLLSPFTLVTKVFDVLFIQLQNAVISFIEFVDSNFYFPWIMGSMPVVISVIYYLLFFTFMKNVQNDKVNKAFTYGIFITLLIICVAIRPYFSPVGSVTMLDIGQGDAFVIELPYRKGVIFIDAGARFSFEDMQPTDNVYKQIIKPYLLSKGINEIDAIFLTHEDTDHVGSIEFMVEDMNIEKIIISNYYDLTEKTKLHWNSMGIQIQRAERDQVIEIGGQTFFVLAPYKNHASSNENSLVLYTRFGDEYWLFTGDIGKSEENEIIKTYPNLIVDVLKIAHHGSNTSTDELFLNQIKPEYALISVGENNSYGHPTSEVLEILEETNAIILRTDRDGAIQYRFTNNLGTFYKYLP